MQSKLLCTIIDLSKLTVNFTVICFLKFASSHPDCRRYCYSLGLCSMQAFVPQQDCVVYLSGIGVIELQLSALTWDWLGFLQTSFHLIRAFWDRNVTFFGASSNCLGRGCPTGNQWSPKQAEAKGLFSYFFITVPGGTADWTHLNTFSCRYLHYRNSLFIFCDLRRNSIGSFPQSGGIILWLFPFFHMHIIFSFHKDCSGWQNTNMPH